MMIKRVRLAKKIPKSSLLANFSILSSVSSQVFQIKRALKVGTPLLLVGGAAT
jgi:hypothetical protein